MGPVMLLMLPGAAVLPAEGQAGALAGQEGCLATAIQGGVADSADADGQ